MVPKMEMGEGEGDKAAEGDKAEGDKK